MMRQDMRIMKIATLLCVIILVHVPALLAQEVQTQGGTCCPGLQFLLGKWDASGSGGIGSSSGVMTFTQDLNGRVIVRRNQSASKQESHEDLMIIYKDSVGAIRADFFDSEGHVIWYEVTVRTNPQSAIFTHPSTDREPGFMFSHISKEDGSLELVFEIAAPGSSEFKPYLKGTARRTP